MRLAFPIAAPHCTTSIIHLLLTSVTGLDRDINFVIMDYLINEGYPSAAKKFALEANIQPKADVDSIQERVEIRNAIHGGDIQTAIEKINELNPQVGLTFQAQPPSPAYLPSPSVLL